MQFCFILVLSFPPGHKIIIIIIIMISRNTIDDIVVSM